MKIEGNSTALTTGKASPRFESRIRISQLTSPKGALPPSLTYLFRQALAQSGLSEQQFDDRLRAYVADSLPGAREQDLENEFVRLTRRFASPEMTFIDLSVSMALLGFCELVFAAK